MVNEISEEFVRSKDYEKGVYPKGCEYCVKGEKITFYINFKCDYNCFYCAVPAELRNTDKMVVGNIPVKTVEEAMKILKKYKCVAISGGDPLINPQRVLEIIRMLKKEGKYVYLFTDGSYKKRLTPNLLKKLVEAGVDEIKLSAKLEGEKIFFEPFKIIKDSPIPIHAEFPMLPNKIKEVYDFAVKLDKIGAKYLLLDQLEFTTGNAKEMLKRGFKQEQGIVIGSKEAVFEVIKRVKENGLSIKILYCKSSNPKHRYKYVN